MSETIDLTNVPSSNFIEEPGSYDVAIVEATEHIFKSGSTGYMLKLRDEYGRTINDRIVLQENTYWKTKAIAEAARLSKEEQAAFHYTKLVGKTLKIICVLDEENYCVVKRYLKSEIDVPVPSPTRSGDEVPF